jgi:cellobiose transport system substrate-binding protein
MPDLHTSAPKMERFSAPCERSSRRGHISAGKGSTIVKSKSRLATAFIVTLAMGAALAGCSSNGSGSSSDDSSSQNFSFWSFTGIDAKADVAKYEKAHKGVHISITEVGSSTDTAQALTTALAGGKVPDLVLIQGDDLPKFVQNPDNFIDLKTLGADKIKKDYAPAIWSQSVAADGQVLGVPTDVGGMALSYRKDLFAAAGLPTDPDQVSALIPTWKDFLAVGKEYTDKTGKPFIDNAETSIFYQAVNQGSQKYYNNKTRKLDYDNAQVKSAFDLAVQGVQDGITANLTSFSTGWSAGLQKGAFAAVATPSWMLGSLKTNAADTKGEWGIAKIPGGSGNWGGSYLAIPKRAEHPKAAWNYIKNAESPEAQLAHFLDSGSLPTTVSNYTNPKLLAATDPFFSDAPIGKIFTESVAKLHPFYIGPDSGQIGTDYQNAIINLENKKISADDAWSSAQTAIKQDVGK